MIKYYLLLLLIVIMGAGARTMFEIAYDGMAKEHDFAPSNETYFLIFLALWYVLMMVFNVVLIRRKEIPGRNAFIVLLSAGVFAPVIYMLLKHA